MEADQEYWYLLSTKLGCEYWLPKSSKPKNQSLLLLLVPWLCSLAKNSVLGGGPRLSESNPIVIALRTEGLVLR